MMALLRDTIMSYEDNKAIKVVVIRHEGKVFSSGHDLKEIDLQQTTTGTTEPIFQLCSSLMLAVRGARFPVIAEVGGLATAGGCQLVAACETSSACSPLSRVDAPRTSNYLLKSSCAFV
jgi:enoyl-CoA hydratase/carnithine racemase